MRRLNYDINYLDSNGGIIHVLNDKTHISTKSQNAIDVMTYLYADTQIYLDRKYKKFEDIISIYKKRDQGYFRCCPIDLINNDGLVLRSFISIKEAAYTFNIHSRSIIKTRNNSQNQINGLKFSYKS